LKDTEFAGVKVGARSRGGREHAKKGERWEEGKEGWRWDEGETCMGEEGEGEVMKRHPA